MTVVSQILRMVLSLLPVRPYTEFCPAAADLTPCRPVTDAPPTRADYPHRRAIATRWKDNDVYGHVNNVGYYSFFDTVINAWLVEEGGLDIHDGAVIGLCAESHCAFHAPLAFPQTVQAALRVGHLGRSGVRYEIGLFGPDADTPAATGWFVHVFVDRADRTSVAIPPPIRGALERLLVSA
jgi:acyl-CoA thioester hydrolase